VVVVVAVAVRVVVADVVGDVVATGTDVVGAGDPVVVAGPVVRSVVAGGIGPGDGEGAALPAPAAAMGPRSGDDNPASPGDVAESLTAAPAPSTGDGPSTALIRIGSG
jgi:hypothetical protein